MAENFEPWEIVEHQNDPEFLKNVIKRAGARGVGPSVWNGALAACQVHVGLQVMELTEALGKSAAAANRHARNLTCATVALVVVTLVLVVATFVLALKP